MKITLNGEALKKKRLEHGQTRDDLLVSLKQAGIQVSAHTLTDWEQGRRTPRQIQLLFAIADVLEFDAKDIILIQEDEDEDSGIGDSAGNVNSADSQKAEAGKRF